MAHERGQLQARLTSWSDLGFWFLERGVLVGGVGYAADATKNVYVEGLYWFAKLLLVIGGYVRLRQVMFPQLDAAQKAAQTPAQSMSLAPSSILPAAIGFAVMQLVDVFVQVMRTPAAH